MKPPCTVLKRNASCNCRVDTAQVYVRQVRYRYIFLLIAGILISPWPRNLRTGYIQPTNGVPSRIIFLPSRCRNPTQIVNLQVNINRNCSTFICAKPLHRNLAGCFQPVDGRGGNGRLSGRYCGDIAILVNSGSVGIAAGPGNRLVNSICGQDRGRQRFLCKAPKRQLLFIQRNALRQLFRYSKSSSSRLPLHHRGDFRFTDLQGTDGSIRFHFGNLRIAALPGYPCVKRLSRRIYNRHLASAANGQTHRLQVNAIDLSHIVHDHLAGIVHVSSLDCCRDDSIADTHRGHIALLIHRGDLIVAGLPSDSIVFRIRRGYRGRQDLSCLARESQFFFRKGNALDHRDDGHRVCIGLSLQPISLQPIIVGLLNRRSARIQAFDCYIIPITC